MTVKKKYEIMEIQNDFLSFLCIEIWIILWIFMGNSKKFIQKYKICKLPIVYHFNIRII